MRIDKFLKVSRLIKRRAAAKDACDMGRVMINGKAAKAGSVVKVGDIVEIHFGNNTITAKVSDLSEPRGKESAAAMFEIV